MAAMMNIAGTTPIEDPEYRYKMPRIVGKVEGRGNGIKTAIPNMTSVALALHRPPGEVTKFFGCELGAQTTWTEETERAIVNGAHTTQVLQDKLSIYIEKFVLCPSCRLPETSYKIRSGIIYHQCVACGAREAVDMQHKLTTFILKTHKLEKDKKKSKESGDKAKAAKAAKQDKSDKGDNDDDKTKKKKKKKDKAELTEEEKAEKKRKKKEKRAAMAADDDDDDDGADDDNGDDDDDDGVVDDTGAMESAINGLRNFLEKDSEAEAAIGEVRKVQTFCALPRNERAFILIAALFGADDKAALSPSPKAFQILAALKADTSPTCLVGGFEKLAVVQHPALLTKFPIVLKKLYDADVLDEKDILEWHTKGLDGADRDLDVPNAVSDDDRAALLKATEPFITWLEQAEEEGDDDDDDDDDDEQAEMNALMGFGTFGGSKKKR